MEATQSGEEHITQELTDTHVVSGLKPLDEAGRQSHVLGTKHAIALPHYISRVTLFLPEQEGMQLRLDFESELIRLQPPD